MKKYILILTLILSSLSFAQNYEMAFSRIEQAFSTSSPEILWPLFSSRMTIRTEDSLYQDISSIQSESVLNAFFLDKDSVEFRFAGTFAYNRTAEGTGVLTYVVDKRKVSTNVDVYLNNYRGDALISAINISNYPSSTAFYNFNN